MEKEEDTERVELRETDGEVLWPAGLCCRKAVRNQARRTGREDVGRESGEVKTIVLINVKECTPVTV